MALTFSKMETEKRNPGTMELDTMSPLEIVTAMNREDSSVPVEVGKHLDEIAQVVEWGMQSLSQGGRIFYMGAGTSGRLGVLDASECPPTFGVLPDTVIGLIAGGERAFTKAVEGAEDSRELGRDDLRERGLTARDLVIGLAASGRTPYGRARVCRRDRVPHRCHLLQSKYRTESGRRDRDRGRDGAGSADRVHEA